MKKRDFRQKGVSLLELIAVVGMISVLVLAARMGYRRMTVRARRTEVKLAMASLHSMMEAHYNRYGTYQTVDNGLFFGDYSCPNPEPGWAKQIGFELVSCPRARFSYTIQNSDNDSFVIIAEGGANSAHKICPWLDGKAISGDDAVVDRWRLDEYAAIDHIQDCLEF